MTHLLRWTTRFIMMVSLCAGAIGCLQDTNTPPNTSTTEDMAIQDMTNDATSGDTTPDAIADVPVDLTDSPLSITLSETTRPSMGRCIALNDGETFGSISPEGHLWLIAKDDTGAAFRIIDPTRSTPQAPSFRIDLPAIQTLHAWTDTEATAIAGEYIWRVTPEGRTRFSPPTPVMTSTSWCGDLTTDGHILTDTALFTQREQQWWKWTPTIDDHHPTTLISQEGACFGPKDVLWATDPEGAIWKLQPPQAERFPVETMPVDLTATAEALAFTADDVFWYGTPQAYKQWRFTNGTPRHLAATNTHLWFSIDKRLVRFDGSTFLPVEHQLDEDITAIYPYGSSGVWLKGDKQICHQSLKPAQIRLMNLRPNTRQPEANTTLEFELVRLDEQTEDQSFEPPTATLNTNTELKLEETDRSGQFTVFVSLPSPGWHNVTITSKIAEQAITRSIWIKHQPPTDDAPSWKEDISPLFQRGCAGNTCHSAESALKDLSTYEHWVTNQELIRQRVVTTKTMPPIGQQSMWSADDIATIQAWLDRGLLP